MAKDKKKKVQRPKALPPRGFRDYFGPEVAERQEMLAKIVDEKWLSAKGSYGFFAAQRQGNDIVLFHSDLMDYDSAIKYDYIILSYVFTLDLANALVHIDKVKSLLKPNGRIYVVDFHKYGSIIYKKYMNWHGIEMGVELLELLESNFKTSRKTIKSVYAGVWEYFMYEGKHVCD